MRFTESRFGIVACHFHGTRTWEFRCFSVIDTIKLLSISYSVVINSVFDEYSEIYSRLLTDIGLF